MNCQSIPNRSNLYLQVLLWLNVRLFAIWSLTYGFYILNNISSFGNIKGLFVIAAYVASNVFELIRLYSGYSGNLKAKPLHLNRFLILTPLILLPLLLFLIISAKEFYAISSLTYCQFALMSLEFIFGVITWQKLCAHQSLIYKLRREMIFQNETNLINAD